MSVYKDGIGETIRVDVGQSLAGATVMQIKVVKPSGATATWTATQYGSTTKIEYTTVAGDLDESGEWRYYSYVEWGSTSKLPGPTAILRVIGPGDISDEMIIEALEAATPLSCQTPSQANAATEENTTAKLLYNSASRTQGNFSIFYAQARRILASDLVRHNLQMTDEEKPLAYAYLIWDLAIKKFPDWEAQTVSPGGSESVTRAKPGQTSAKAAYLDILKGSKRRVGTTPEIGHLDDYTNYPENMHPCPIDHERLAGDDY